jgi:hypothetical protein
MKPITKTRLILAALVTVHVVLRLMLIDLFGDTPIPRIRDIPTQGILLGFWIAMGRRWAIPWRACLGIGIIAVVDFVQNALQTEYDPCSRILIWEMWLVALILLVLRITGLRMVYADVPATPGGPLQFSLFEILNWTTATAVFIALVKCFALYHHPITLSSIGDLSGRPKITSCFMDHGD